LDIPERRIVDVLAGCFNDTHGSDRTMEMINTVFWRQQQVLALMELVKKMVVEA
jgi:hypothetical protein